RCGGRRGDARGGWCLPEGVSNREGREVGARVGPVPADLGAADGGLLRPRERADRAGASAPGRAARAAHGCRAREMKTAAVIAALIVALALQTTGAGLRAGGTKAG